MNKDLYYLSITMFLALLSTNSHGRMVSSDYTGESPARIRYLASKRDTTAIYVIGVNNDRDAIPILQKLAVTPAPPATDRFPLRASFAAKASLTKMGVHDYFNEFIVQLSTTDPFWKEEVIGFLGDTGDTRAIKYLGPLLSDDRKPHVPATQVSATFAECAADALGDILQPPFMGGKKREPSSPLIFLDEWRQWWKENKDKYQ